MNCKECVHNEVCYCYLLTYTDNNPICCYFKDKSRFIELPCKVGDVVYQATRNFISEFRVRFIEIANCGNLYLHTDLISGIVYTGEVFSGSDISKTVFIRREEAEKALKERERE